MVLEAKRALRAADTWANAVVKAKQEGLVVVHGAPAKAYDAVFTDAFNKAYPDIKVQFCGGIGLMDFVRAA